MAFPPAFLERLRSHFLLSDVIGKRMPLKKHGKEWMGLCPFHGEKTPSFTVNNDKNFFHCFGCSAHGDAIEFVKRYEKLTYPETIEKLAAEAGIPVPAMTREAREQAEQHKTLEGAMETAAQYFEQNLRLEAHFAARDYLRNRGLSAETVAQFRIGYAPDSRDGLKRHLLSKGFTEAQLIEAGLIIKPEGGSASYDRFRERIMFPIRNQRGRVIAFGGRLHANPNAQATKHLPKYLNSPETPLFKKGHVLFNLDSAGPAARELGEIVIVEGYMDVIMMVQGGFPHAVATLGTAVTPDHLRLLWQQAPEPVLCLDGDAAGKRAMLRAAEIALPLITPGLSLRFAVLPKGEDPDSLVKNQGPEALRRVLAEASGLPETLWRYFSESVPQTADARAALDHRLGEVAKQIQNATIRTHYRSYFSKQIWSRTFNSPHKQDKKQKPALRSVEIARAAQSTQQDMQQKTLRQLLKILLLQPALLHDADVEDYLSRMECINPALDQLRSAMLHHGAHGAANDSAALLILLNEEGFAHAAQGLLSDEGFLLPKNLCESIDTARSIWQKLLHTHALTALQDEYEALQRDLNGNVDETVYERFLELQKQLKVLRASAPVTDAEREGA